MKAQMKNLNKTKTKYQAKPKKNLYKARKMVNLAIQSIGRQIN